MKTSVVIALWQRHEKDLPPQAHRLLQTLAEKPEFAPIVAGQFALHSDRYPVLRRFIRPLMAKEVHDA